MAFKVIGLGLKALSDELKSIEKNIKFFKRLAWFFVILGGLFAIFIFVWKLINPKFVLTFIEVGTFYSGVLTGTFSLAGLMFIYVAYLGQRISIINQQKELILTRAEMKSNRDELAGQKLAMERQNQNIVLQRFENNFYKMIDNLNNQINNLYYLEKHEADFLDSSKKEKIIHHYGINVFKYFSLIFLSYFNDPTKSDRLKKSDIILNKDNLGNVLLNIKKRFHSQFRQIFRIIKYIFDYIENNYKGNNIEENHYNFYKKYVKIQIPEYLKFIIALYRIYDEKSQLARDLIDKYKIIEQYDFYNYISNKKEYPDFMSKLGIKIKAKKENNINKEKDN